MTVTFAEAPALCESVAVYGNATVVVAPAANAVAARTPAFQPPEPGRLRREQAGAAEGLDLPDQRALDLDRVVLLAQRPGLGQLIDRVVDAANEGHAAVDDHQLAVHAAQQVDADAEQHLGRLVAAQADTRFEQWAGERRRQVGRAPAVDHHVHGGPAPGGAQQCLLQPATDHVVEQDEGLQQHLVFGRGDGLEDAGEVGLAVLEQRDAVVGQPV